MEWVLFVFVLGQGPGSGVAITSAVFHTEEGCRHAADSAEVTFDPYAEHVKTLCVPNDPERH